MSARRKILNKLVDLFRPGYVYKTVNTVNGKKYIGSKLLRKGHKGTNFDSNYYGSGVDLKKAIDKYGKDKFINVKEIDTKTISELKSAEQGLLGRVDAGGSKDYYNRHNNYTGGDIATGFKRGPMSDEHKIKIGLGNKGKSQTQEAKDKISTTLKGRKHTEKSKSKMSKARQGKKPWNAGMTKEEQAIYRQTKGLL